VTLYVVVYPSGDTEPSAAQIKAGNSGTGAATWAAGSGAGVAWTGTGQQVVASGLAAGTTYKSSAVVSDGVTDGTPVHSAAFRTSYLLTCDAGSYSLSGQAATLAVGRNVTLDAGSYAVTGNAATLTIARALALDAGSYAVTGRDAALTVSRTLALDAGSYSVTGRDAALDYFEAGDYPPLNASAGTYALTGRDAALTVSRALSLDVGSYTFTGGDATLSRRYALAADAGSYALDGGDVATKRDYALVCDAGHYTISGRDASLIYSGAPQAPQEPQARGGGRSRFVEARKRLPMPFLIDWLTNEEPSAQTKRVIAEIKAGRPIPRDAKPPKGPENISATRLAVQILPSRAFVFKTYLADLVHASRTVEKAVALATERDDEDILMLL